MKNLLSKVKVPLFNLPKSSNYTKMPFLYFSLSEPIEAKWIKQCNKRTYLMSKLKQKNLKKNVKKKSGNAIFYLSNNWG